MIKQVKFYPYSPLTRFSQVKKKTCLPRKILIATIKYNNDLISHTLHDAKRTLNINLCMAMSATHQITPINMHDNSYCCCWGKTADKGKKVLISKKISLILFSRQKKTS